MILRLFILYSPACKWGAYSVCLCKRFLGQDMTHILKLWTILGLLLPGLALGQEFWTVSGFASLGAGRIQDDNLEFMDYNSERWSFEGDSVLGLQLDLNLAERLSLVTQVVSRGYHWDNTSEFEPELDWFFLRYQLNANWRARVGRMRTPLYLYSETLDVGYSYAWARPPMDVYSPLTSPFANFDGADLVYLSDWDDYSLDIQLLAGKMRRGRDSMTIDVDPMLGGNITLQNEDLSLRYGLLMMNTDIRLGAYDRVENYYQLAGSAIAAFIGVDISQQFDAISNGFSADNNWFAYQSLGMRWSPGRFTTIAEVFDNHNTDNQYDHKARGGYLSLLYQLPPFTPYVVAGYYDSKFGKDALAAVNSTYAFWPANQTLPLLQVQVDTLDQLRQLTVDYIDSLNYTQKTWTLGIRYDLMSNVALKAEWQYFDVTAGKGGLLVWTAPEVTDHTSMTTFVIDVVF